MARVYVNIGSNLGNKKEIIAKAISLLEKEYGTLNISELVESPPWGFESANSFFNIGVSFESEEEPLEILGDLQRIEKAISYASHRDSNGNYIDRTIDIDIMAIDGLIFNHPRLRIPHPHLHERIFFIKPMMELCPDWIHPETGDPIATLYHLSTGLP